VKFLTIELNKRIGSKAEHFSMSNYFRSTGLALLYFFSACMIFIILIGCEEKIKPTVINTTIRQDLPTQESWNSTITISDSGKMLAVIRSGHISAYPERQYTLFDSNITVDFYDEHERHSSVLTAKTAKVSDVTHDLEAHGNVIVVSDSGTTLKTEELFWNNRTKKVTSQVYVDIVSPSEHIQGQGFESDRGLRNYVIFKVTGQAKAEK
jgi:LPS export ABC transporter protein LptC